LTGSLDRVNKWIGSRRNGHADFLREGIDGTVGA
jgi:hypothetical protein